MNHKNNKWFWFSEADACIAWQNGKYRIELVKDGPEFGTYDLFLANYGLQGLYALILKGNFIANKNYYEDFVDSYSWWPTH